MATKYKVVSPIQHDGEVFVPGNPEFVTESQLGGKKALRALVDAGAVEVVNTSAAAAEVEEEPPGNYRDPDLRLGSGDPSKPGSAVLDIMTAEPTNIPKVAFTQLNPSIPEPIGTTPQAQVAEKMAAQQEEAGGPTLEEQQEARDKEQQQGAKAGAKAASGGETSPKKAAAAAEKQESEQGAVKPSTETPPPAQATGGGNR